MERLADVLRRLGLSAPSEDGTPDQPGADCELACPICGGAGFVVREVSRDHPDFGRAFPCRCREQSLEVRRRERLERLSNLGPLTRLTFDTLFEEGRNPESEDHRQRFRRVLDAARVFSEVPEGWLVLVGPAGCGKTHLAAAIANRRIELGEPAVFVVVPDVLDHLRATFAPSSETTYDELFDNLRTCPLLILDDLGTQSSTPWATEKLYQLFNARYNNRLPTVITTNHPLDELDERLRIRLSDPEFSQVWHVQPPQAETLHGVGAMPRLLQHMRFESFEVEGRTTSTEEKESLSSAFEVSAEFARDPQGWLILQGPCGCGKTHLAAAIANHHARLNQAATFVSVPDLLDHLRSTFAPDSPVTYDQLFEAIRGAPLLVLDDLGTHSATPWAEEKLYQLLNHRYNALLPTVVTTNLPIDALEPRLASRLGDERLSQMVEIDAPDFRRPDAPRRAPQRRAPPARPRPPR